MSHSNNLEEDEIPDLVPLETYESKKVIPVTILTGFLGSGKTTLLNHILTSYHGKKIAVIENEFSDGLGIEKMIAKNGVDGSDLAGFFELNNGCICCSVKGDLVTTLEQLIQHKAKFDYIVIETTGVANPGPIIAELWTDDDSADNNIGSLKLDGVITLIDSYNIEYYLKSSDTSTDICTQIAYADRILLNKTDLIDSSKIASVEAIVRSLNAAAEIVPTSFSKVSPNWVLDIDGYSVRSVSSLQWGAWDASMSCVPCAPNNTTNSFTDTSRIKELSKEKTNRAAQSMISKVAPVSAMLSKTIGTSTHSADSLTSIGLSFSTPINLQKIKLFVDSILYSSSTSQTRHGTVPLMPPAPPSRWEEDGEASLPGGSSEKDVEMMNTDETSSSMKIYRMKGILRIVGCDYLFILQAVHEVFDIQESSIRINSVDDNSNGFSRIIVIGRNIDRDLIQKGIQSCTHECE
mmetsp:Transcript_8061/g.8202  ORF Transcript_8061/g.8202 Transcript_8061/m.8202 type:complete len:463 (-) Transcript_8061:23-1411(-)